MIETRKSVSVDVEVARVPIILLKNCRDALFPYGCISPGLCRLMIDLAEP